VTWSFTSPGRRPYCSGRGVAKRELARPSLIAAICRNMAAELLPGLLAAGPVPASANADRGEGRTVELFRGWPDPSAAGAPRRIEDKIARPAGPSPGGFSRSFRHGAGTGRHPAAPVSVSTSREGTSLPMLAALGGQRWHFQIVGAVRTALVPFPGRFVDGSNSDRRKTGHRLVPANCYPAARWRPSEAVGTGAGGGRSRFVLRRLPIPQAKTKAPQHQAASIAVSALFSRGGATLPFVGHRAVNGG